MRAEPECVWIYISRLFSVNFFFSDLFPLKPLFDGASSTLHNWDLLSTSRVYSGLLHAFIADSHTPLYLIKTITHIRVAKKKKAHSILKPFLSKAVQRRIF
jgi:hypothetical protein